MQSKFFLTTALILGISLIALETNVVADCKTGCHSELESCKEGCDSDDKSCINYCEGEYQACLQECHN